MPTFETPEPITAEIHMFVGTLQINAGDRSDTAVDVRPRDAAKDVDVRAAEQVRVSCTDGRLLVEEPSTASRLLVRNGVIDVTVDLPAGSRIQAETRDANIRCEGRLGASDITTTNGSITLDRLTGDARLTSGYGWVRAQEIDGGAAVKTSSGAITLGTVTGPLRMNTAHGAIAVERTLDSVEARTAHGTVRIGEVVRGRVDLETSYGELEIGIREGTAAWLDVGSKKGTVRSSLAEAEGPGDAEETAEVRARSTWGDIIVRRT
ncbi:hypothetical protein FZ103_11505 [Streptomonospora sp. PA3]|uniref:DUF4097 family beta strand repeat-containing protein n=1 Tax=Streptomonospora sp. PA3 TaxID=2607326 RepID=UPI0012DC2F23|nr:DUF4097 family beta strand repeat-containing protein [Streptomonospora sp. PA3]MUL41794.1 hypothetical protein [Streptomonospora sp. PA3]